MTLVFCASGAAGLIFEVVWFHRAGLLFGHSIWATSVVFASFMGGSRSEGRWLPRSATGSSDGCGPTPSSKPSWRRRGWA
jgi:predicted membrane-bound spermidine synthase